MGKHRTDFDKAVRFKGHRNLDLRVGERTLILRASATRISVGVGSSRNTALSYNTQLIDPTHAQTARPILPRLEKDCGKCEGVLVPCSLAIFSDANLTWSLLLNSVSERQGGLLEEWISGS